MTVRTAAAADLDELDRATTLAELQQLVIDQEAAAGLVPPGAVRPMFPWEVAACTNFAELSNALDGAQAAAARALARAREAVTAALLEAVRYAPTEAAAQQALHAAIAAQPREVREALADSAREIDGILSGLYSHGANLLVREAAAQKVTGAADLLDRIAPEAGRFATTAEVAPQSLWQRLSQAALLTNGTRAPDADTLEQTLAGTSVQGAVDLANQATNVAIGSGRAAAQSQLPTPVAVYASELLDGATCGPCAEIDGYEYATADQAYNDYPDAGPYVRCDGEDRCRGTLVFSYDESDGTADGADPNWDTSVDDGADQPLPGLPEPDPSWSRPPPAARGPVGDPFTDPDQLPLEPPPPAPAAPAPGLLDRAVDAIAQALRSRSVDQLAEQLDTAYNADDTAAIERLEKELDRRDGLARQAAAQRERRAAARDVKAQRQAEHIQRLIGEGEDPYHAVEQVTGQSVEAQRRLEVLNDLRLNGYGRARGFDEAVRMRWRDLVAEQIVEAEQYTRGGSMLNRAGQQARINEDSLFFGSEATARKYASPELRQYWDDHGRLTLESLRAQLLGGMPTDRGIQDFLQ